MKSFKKDDTILEIVCNLKTSYKEVNGSCSAGENRKGPEETAEEPSPVKLSIIYIVLKILMNKPKYKIQDDLRALCVYLGMYW